MPLVFDIDRRWIAAMIDHSLLRPEMTVASMEAQTLAAAEMGVATVCCMPWFVRRCADLLDGSATRASTVIGFPLGYATTDAKLAEAAGALDDGAVELDAVVNISAVVSDDWDTVVAELRALTELVHGRDGKLKAIFENGYLNDTQKLRLCSLAGEIGVDWVKTATGFGPCGATVGDVRLMRAGCPATVGVKAAGGIKSINDLVSFIRAGADRIGCSATRSLLEQIV